MELTPEEYAHKLIEKYAINIAFNTSHMCLQCAMIDVNNTIESLESLDSWTKLHVNEEIQFYKEVSKILYNKL